MKIVFLLQSFPCLSETFILNQITGMIESGCDIRIIAFNKENDSKRHPDIYKYRLFKKTTYIKIPKFKCNRRIKAMLYIFMGFFQHPVSVYRLLKLLFNDNHSFSYRRLFLGLQIVNRNIDILQCHYGPVANQVIFLKEIGLKTKISTVFHGYDLSVYLNEHGSNVYLDLFAKGDLFLPISNFWKQKLIDLGCPKEKTVVNHMGVDSSFFEPGRSRKSNSVINILTVARLTEKKGHHYALEAIQKVLDVIPDIQYHIAGDGPLLGELREKTHQLGIEKHVVFHGKINSSEVLHLYHKSDIFLLPSITSSKGDMEGIPVSLMEAMACGLPVITSIHSGISELVIDQQTGFTVPEKDVASIATHIIRLIKEPELKQIFRKNAREHVKKNFENRILFQQLLELFKNLITPAHSNSNKKKWRKSIRHELKFWDDYFRTKGLQWKDNYQSRLALDLPLQPHIAELLPIDQEVVKILDVGAGPLTFLGKKCIGKKLQITAVDPLANEYNKILLKYNVRPVIRTEKLDAENLTTRFPANSFDLVFARNCIDHAYSPEKAILEMIAVAKKGRYVVMEHRLNEAEKKSYHGLHQWNFSRTPEGDFHIHSKNYQLNFSEKYKDICRIDCEIDTINDWLITKIMKIQDL